MRCLLLALKPITYQYVSFPRKFIASFARCRKVLKSLNDRQSDIFPNFKESKKPIQFKLWYVDCQAIQKSCIGRSSSVWFTLGSESETLVCDTEFL